jgi:catecholate siderophore receptor
MFAAVDNTVSLPGYTRVDAAVFILLAERTQLQVNAENLGGARYYLNADSNTNISPGAPRSLRVGLNTSF